MLFPVSSERSSIVFLSSLLQIISIRGLILLGFVPLLSLMSGLYVQSVVFGKNYFDIFLDCPDKAVKIPDS